MSQTIEKKQNWLQLLSIQAGGTICLPLILVGQLICQKFGWLAALLAVGCGNVFLLVIGFLLATLSTDRPKSTVQHATNYFGDRGGPLFASLMMLSMLGWFGMQLNIMSLGLQQFLGVVGISIPSIFLNMGIGVLLSSVMCLGLKAMKWLSNFCAPLLGLTLLYAFFSSQGSLPLAAPLTISWLGGVSLIVGANIAAVIDLPTFLRHAKSSKDARICIFLLYGLIVPFIEAVGIYLSAATGGTSILGIFQASQGLLWMIWVSCFIFLSGWATNNTNLYSALTSSYSLPGRFKPAKRTLVLGAIGTAIACFNPLGNMEVLLDLFSVAIGSMGAVILSGYIWGKNNVYPWISFLSWGVGITIGLASSFFHWFITGAPVFDAFIASFITKISLNYFYKNKEIYETNNTR